MKANNIIGQTFGRLTVLNRAKNDKWGGTQWHCKCECQTLKIVAVGKLTTGRTKSCGCLSRELASVRVKTHGMSRTATYRSWKNMQDRCLNKRNKKYKYYGGRGITICDRWLESFENFYEDMGEAPAGLTLDRIKNAGNYTPANCRWATRRQQSNNTRSNRLITYIGQTLSLTQWSRRTGIARETLAKRIKIGWSVHDALTKPVGEI